MGALDTLRTITEISKLAIDGGVAIIDARRRQREEDERREAARRDVDKDRRIAELEAELSRLRDGRP